MAELLKEGELSPGKSSDAGDQEFEPSADMLVHDYDDEQTLAEEEALAIAGGEDPQNELNSLQKESDMPLEELLALYGYGERGGGGSGGGEERIRTLDEDMEDDDEDDDDEEEEEEDDSVESTSSSSTALVQEAKGTKRPGSKSETSGEAPASKSLKTEGSGSIRPKSRSDLHLLYAQSTEEGSLPEARLLRSAGAAGANAGDEEDEGDEEDDVDYAPGEDEWRKTIMIGSDYQAYVPSGLSPYENNQTLPYENEDKLLWTPSQVAAPLTEEYLQKCTQIQQQLMQSRIAAATASQPLQTLALLASLPLGAHTRDDEQALHLLLQCGYNVEEALRRRKMSTVTPCDTASLWSEEECRNFEAGLRIFGKDFHHIQQQKVRTRSVGELVQFYYLWKKTERHDVLANRARLEKKKYALHPGTTDYMDRFLDEQEQPTNVVGGIGAGAGHGGRDRSHSRSSSPNVHSLIYGDPKRLRVVATPPAAASEDGAVSGSNGVVHPPSASMVDGAAMQTTEDNPGLVNISEAESGNGQVLSAAAAAAAAAAAVLPPSSSSSANASSSSSSASSSASSPSSAAAAGGETKTQRTEASS